jgi:hypothetical protein
MLKGMQRRTGVQRPSRDFRLWHFSDLTGLADDVCY